MEELNKGREKPLGPAYLFTAKFVYVFLAALVFGLSILYKGIG